MNQDNRKRALAEVVSLDAWHEGFTQKRDRVDLHVDVAFTAGRIGEPNEAVRFKLRLKRAEVVVIIPPTEPAKVDKSSVARDTPETLVTKRASTKSNQKIKGKAQIKASGGPACILPVAKGSIGGAMERASEQATVISETLQSMKLLQRLTPDGDYVWVVEPSSGSHLEGHPWKAKKEPRLKVIDKRPDRTKGIEPNIRVEVRCRREDLEITEITLTDRTAWDALTKDPFGRNKLAAAEAVIRTRLFHAGLLHGDISDPYAQMTLSAVIAEGQ